MGKLQSGKDIFANMKIARLPEDSAMMNDARETAAELIHRYGLDPRNWPPSLLVGLARRRLPKMDYGVISD